ncbi:MAG: cellulase family glycosylhydrolase, partial [Bacteroidales bacterium]|nr:cellulase family glycosylhydrolase [Bacteroidales bacterium]
FDVVRIPVRWDKHTGNNAPFNVDKTWMDRVEEVVDWGLERDLFIIINAHHDNWIKDNYNNATYRARFDSIWSQIALRFRNKSEKLIFEVLNEPHGLTKAQNDEMHQRILNIIRRTNPTRLVVFQGNGWGSAEDLLEAAIPDDDYLIGSFHSYDPWPFGLEGTGPFGPAEINALKRKFADVKEWSLSNDIPVLLGEFGCNKEADYNLRMKHYFTYTELAAEHGFTPCAWDDGGTFRIMERQTSGWNEIKDILIHSTSDAPGGPSISLLQDTIIQLKWTNRVTDHDSIIIERKTSLSGFSKYAVLPPDSTRVLDVSPFPKLYYHYRIIANYTDTADLYSYPVRIFMPEYVQPERGLFLGEPQPIPGIIEAEDFDLGGEGIAYHDAESLNIAGEYRPDEGVDIY